jgi:hypothetical protein
MLNLLKLLVPLLLAVGLAAQPAGPVRTQNPVASGGGSTFTMQDTASPPSTTGTVDQSNSSFWDLKYPNNTATVLFERNLPQNADYAGTGWVEFNQEESTGYIYIYYKNWQGQWRWDKRSCALNSSGEVASIGASSAGFGSLSGVIP